MLRSIQTSNYQKNPSYCDKQFCGKYVQNFITNLKIHKKVCGNEVPPRGGQSGFYLKVLSKIETFSLKALCDWPITLYEICGISTCLLPFGDVKLQNYALHPIEYTIHSRHHVHVYVSYSFENYSANIFFRCLLTIWVRA